MKTALSGIPDDEKKAMSKKALADLKVASFQLWYFFFKLDFLILKEIVLFCKQAQRKILEKFKIQIKFHQRNVSANNFHLIILFKRPLLILKFFNTFFYKIMPNFVFPAILLSGLIVI